MNYKLQLGKYEFFPYDNWFLELIDKLNEMRSDIENLDELTIEEKLEKLKKSSKKKKTKKYG